MYSKKFSNANNFNFSPRKSITYEETKFAAWLLPNHWSPTNSFKYKDQNYYKNITPTKGASVVFELDSFAV